MKTINCFLCLIFLLAFYGREGSSSSGEDHGTEVSLVIQKPEPTYSTLLGNNSTSRSGVNPSLNSTYKSSIGVQVQNSQPWSEDSFSRDGFLVQVIKGTSLSAYQLGDNENARTGTVIANNYEYKPDELKDLEESLHDITKNVPLEMSSTNNSLFNLEEKPIFSYNHTLDQRKMEEKETLNRTLSENVKNIAYIRTSRKNPVFESMHSITNHTNKHTTELRFSVNVPDSRIANISQYLHFITEDKELKETLQMAWNETQRFLNSGNLNAGMKALTFLQDYIDNRRVWIRNIRFVFPNNTDFILDEGKSIQDRIKEFDYEEESLKRLENIFRLATFVNEMHDLEYDLQPNETEIRGIGTLVKEGKIYLKSFETALSDLERIYMTRDYMFPLLHSNSDTFAVMNGTVKNETNKFAALEKVFRYYVYPSVYFIILVIGVVGNGTLLIMFAKRKEIRTGPNVMVFNLAITDVLNLFINTPLYYVSKFHSELIYLDGYGCRMFVITRFTVHTVLAISIVALAVQRYCATVQNLRRASENWGLSMQFRTFIYMFSVWLVAVMCAMPTAIVFEYKNGICFPYAKFQVAVQVLDIFYFTLFVFILPITMIVFSMMTAKRLRISVRNIPGVMRNSYQKNSRHRSARVVTSLAIAYCVSHIPRSVWFFLLTFLHWSRRDNIYFIFIDEITNYLMFSNSCLNPLALYFASGSFKRLFRVYLCCSVPNNGRRIMPLNIQMATNSRGRLLSIIEGLSTEINGSKASLFEKQRGIHRVNSEACVDVKDNSEFSHPLP